MQKLVIRLMCYFIPIKRFRCRIKARHQIASKKHLKKKFSEELGYKLNLENPKTFNEKINWLKFNENIPLKTKCADKYAVREYIKEKGFKDILVELYGVWDRPEDIIWDDLPQRFVLKTNNDSGSVWIVKNKRKFDKNAFLKEAKKALKQVFGIKNAEFYYADIPPKIIAEKYLENENDELIDYKLACYNGVPQYTSVHFNRSAVLHEMRFYDLNWNDMNFSCEGHNNVNKTIPRPKNFMRMVEIGKALSKEFKFVRVDLYVVDDKIYFGEMTFSDGSGFNKFTPEIWDKKLGDLLEINPSISEKKHP